MFCVENLFVEVNMNVILTADTSEGGRDKSLHHQHDFEAVNSRREKLHNAALKKIQLPHTVTTTQPHRWFQFLNSYPSAAAAAAAAAAALWAFKLWFGLLKTTRSLSLESGSSESINGFNVHP